MPLEAPVSLYDVADRISAPWQPVDVTKVNDAIVRLARFAGEFPWHRHDEDELFLCWQGSFRIELADGESVTLNAGDMFVVPAEHLHRPVAQEEALALLLERPETLQYGN